MRELDFISGDAIGITAEPHWYRPTYIEGARDWMGFIEGYGG